MSEAAFPLLGSAFVFLVALPVCALVAKGLLVLLERDDIGGALRAMRARYLVLTGFNAFPFIWFFSAALHQSEAGSVSFACLLSHVDEACMEPGLFAALLLVIAMGSSARVLRDACCVSRLLVRAAPPDARITEITANRPQLRALHGRVKVVHAERLRVGTFGLLRPVVLVEARFAAALSEEMLASALGHEAEHVRRLDPLRFVLLRLSMAVNPFGRLLLEPHATRWLAAREAECDREAVVHGSEPLALAEAMVRAARPSLEGGASLGSPDTRVLALRIGMLLAFSEARPTCRCGQGPSALALAALLFMTALFLPHGAGTSPLDAVHSGAEQALGHFLP